MNDVSEQEIMVGEDNPDAIDVSNITDGELYEFAVQAGVDFHTARAEYLDAEHQLHTSALDVEVLAAEMERREWPLEQQKAAAYEVADKSGEMSHEEVDKRFAAYEAARTAAQEEAEGELAPVIHLPAGLANSPETM